MATDKHIEFFLNSTSDIVELDLLEISHSQFSETFRIVRNAVEGITLPDNRFFKYYPAKVEALADENNLDYGRKVVLGDLSEILMPEIKQLKASDSLTERPKVTHYIYRHDDLTSPMDEISNIEIDDFTFDTKNSYFIAKAPTVNNTKTGRVFDMARFWMLEDFL